MNVVLPSIRVSRAFWISASESLSRDEAASSSIDGLNLLNVIN